MALLICGHINLNCHGVHNQPCFGETGSLNRKWISTPRSWPEVFPNSKWPQHSHCCVHGKGWLYSLAEVCKHETNLPSHVTLSCTDHGLQTAFALPSPRQHLLHIQQPSDKGPKRVLKHYCLDQTFPCFLWHSIARLFNCVPFHTLLHFIVLHIRTLVCMCILERVWHSVIVQEDRATAHSQWNHRLYPVVPRRAGIVGPTNPQRTIVASMSGQQPGQGVGLVGLLVWVGSGWVRRWG